MRGVKVVEKSEREANKSDGERNIIYDFAYNENGSVVDVRKGGARGSPRLTFNAHVFRLNAF